MFSKDGPGAREKRDLEGRLPSSSVSSPRECDQLSVTGIRHVKDARESTTQFASFSGKYCLSLKREKKKRAGRK